MLFKSFKVLHLTAPIKLDLRCKAGAFSPCMKVLSIPALQTVIQFSCSFPRVITFRRAISHCDGAFTVPYIL